ncbi:MAG: sigma-54 dependent transcriptional regulator [Gemmataceae bacterium]|nr:sigma-54 dependent transcriptional regulator [Gemmataceae bacterium]
MPHILIVDDEEAVCWVLRRACEQAGYSVAAAGSAEAAFEQARRQQPDAIILDVRLPGLDGIAALPRLRALAGNAPVIVMTAFADLHTAVRAVQAGACEYLPKPFDLTQALEAVARALRMSAPASLAPEGSSMPVAGIGEDEIVGRSPAMQVVFKRIALVAPRDACVLITGESGTGKELVARAIHRHSERHDRPFLPVHVAALNPNLVESELFGHVKGAFTGAAQARPGLLELADGGTVFLDELADIPLAVQVKLLRVLEQNLVLPVGGNESHRLNVRILSATHQDLSRRMAEGAFRHDLYFRLNVFQVHLPPLRERTEDITALAEHFLRRFEPRALPLLPDTIQHLTSQQWLGNVRELRHALEHAAIVARGGPLEPEHFPKAVPQPEDAAARLADAVRLWLGEQVRDAEGKPSGLYAELLQCVESALLDEIMRSVRGNRWAAARRLGLNRTTVRKKLRLLGLADAYRDDATEDD